MDWCSTGSMEMIPTKKITDDLFSKLAELIPPMEIIPPTTVDTPQMVVHSYDNDTSIMGMGFDEYKKYFDTKDIKNDLVANSMKYIEPFIKAKSADSYLRMEQGGKTPIIFKTKEKLDMDKITNVETITIKDPRVVSLEKLVDKWVVAQNELLASICEDAKESLIASDTLNADIEEVFDNCYKECCAVLDKHNEGDCSTDEPFGELVVRVDKNSAMEILRHYLTPPCIYTDETKADLEEVVKYKRKTSEWIADTAETVKLLLNSLPSDFVYAEGIEILKQYDVVNENGVFRKDDISFCLCELCDILGFEDDEDEKISDPTTEGKSDSDDTQESKEEN